MVRGAIPVPVIIPEERFKRLGVARRERSPRKTPPLHCTPPSLLTGLVRCGYCQGSMHIATGKGGRYRYFKCNRRNCEDNRVCNSPNVPADKLETLVLETVVEQVLTDTRVSAILEDCQANMQRIGEDEAVELRSLQHALTQVDMKLGKLYGAIESGLVRQDKSLSERIQTLQDDRVRAESRLSDLKVRVLPPKTLLSGLDVETFTAKMRAILADRQSDQAKAFLRLFVSEIRVYADEATITGANFGALEAAAHSKKGTLEAVPSFIHKWRRG